jgi:hypothetical protein
MFTYEFVFVVLKVDLDNFAFKNEHTIIVDIFFLFILMFEKNLLEGFVQTFYFV